MFVLVLILLFSCTKNNGNSNSILVLILLFSCTKNNGSSNSNDNNIMQQQQHMRDRPGI